MSTINNTMMIVVQSLQWAEPRSSRRRRARGTHGREGRVAGDALALGTALSLAAALLLFFLRVPLIS